MTVTREHTLVTAVAINGLQNRPGASFWSCSGNEKGSGNAQLCTLCSVDSRLRPERCNFRSWESPGASGCSSKATCRLRDSQLHLLCARCKRRWCQRLSDGQVWKCRAATDSWAPSGSCKWSAVQRSICRCLSVPKPSRTGNQPTFTK